VAALSCVNTPPPPPPSYCTASATTCDEYISRVQINTINNASACTTGGYANYTTLTTKVSPGFTYLMTVTNGNLNWPTDQCGIWVDWNYDGDFTDSGETMTVSGSPGIGPYTSNVIPPVNAHKGMTRMRTRITYGTAPLPCGTTSYGEVEDYGIYVGTPGLWDGGTAGSETSWNTANNWNDGRVPTAGTDVIIPAGSAYYPLVTGSYTCLDIEIKDGAQLTIQPGATMNITGDLNVGQGTGGTLTVNGGTCNVTGLVNALPGSTVDVKNGGLLNNN
jgi:hypothetical protein